MTDEVLAHTKSVLTEMVEKEQARNRAAGKVKAKDGKYIDGPRSTASWLDEPTEFVRAPHAGDDAVDLAEAVVGLTDTIRRAVAQNKFMVYVAGPITGNPWGCVKQATDVFPKLRSIGLVPILPQLSVIHEMVNPLSYEEWIEYDLDLIENCDLLMKLPGESPGADRETMRAKGLDIPVVEFDQHDMDAGFHALLKEAIQLSIDEATA